MTNGVIKTQGTHLFFVNPMAEEPEIIKMACPTGLTGMTAGSKERIQSTCLDAIDDHEYESGLGDPGAASVPFNFVPTHPSHQMLISNLKDTGQKLNWLVALSDGTSAPTLDPEGVMVPPADRTSAEFVAYVADADIDISTNELVRGTLSLQRSGAVKWNWKS